MNERVEKLKQLVRIEEYAQYLDYHVVRLGRYYTLEEHDSVRINPATNRYFRNSVDEPYSSGSVINFAMYFGHKSYKEAVADLEAFVGSARLEKTSYIRPVNRYDAGKKKMLMLPARGGSRRHAYAYLNQVRKIDRFIIDYMFASSHLYEDKMKNCVFVSYDEETHKPDFACKRGTLSDIPFKGDVEGCSYEYCFRLPARNGKRLYVCEAVIDLLSLMTYFLKKGIDKQTVASWHYQALSSTKKYHAIFSYLLLHPEIEEVYLALDNDDSGNKAVERIINVAKEKEFTQSFIPYLPEWNGWDWNDVIRKDG